MTTKIDGTLGVDLIKDGTVKAADFDPSLFLANLASSGYQKLPSGLIIQWGLVNSTGGDVAVVFPTPFGTAALSVVANVLGAPSSVQLFSTSVDGLTVSGFNLRKRFQSNNTTTVAAEPANWIAIGY